MSQSESMVSHVKTIVPGDHGHNIKKWSVHVNANLNPLLLFNTGPYVSLNRSHDTDAHIHVFEAN